MPSATQELRRRFLTLDPTDADTDTFELSFSSETPVARQYGDEVLSHAAGAVDLSRLNDSAPLLFNHNPDQLLGVVDSARVVGGKGRATVRWGTSPEAAAKRQDVAIGVLRNVSVGYQINEMDQDEDGNYVARNWTPVEISLVSVPSDPTVGIGRSLENDSVKTMTQAPVEAIALGYPERDEFALNPISSQSLPLLKASPLAVASVAVKPRSIKSWSSAMVAALKASLSLSKAAGVSGPMSLVPLLLAAT